MISLAIDNMGSLWMWGNCPQKSNTTEAKFCLLSNYSPQPVWDLHGHTVVKVACGNEHVLAAVSSGETYTGNNLVCYAWGNNNYGQLGLGAKQSSPRPEIIPTFNQDSLWSVYEIVCGSYHTAILTHYKSYEQEIGSRCWTFGLGDNGQLGHGTTQSIRVPEPVTGLPSDAILISVDCGLFHTSVISAAGDVWSWGMEKGLGLCPDASFTSGDAGDALNPLRIQPKEVNEFTFAGTIQVACGAAHTVLVADNGYKLWAWGRGRSGVLGHAQIADSYTPCAVMWPPLDKELVEENVRIINVAKDARNFADKDNGEMNQKLTTLMQENNLLQKKLDVMERYANVLHTSVFRKPFHEQNIPHSLKNSGAFDIRKELENMMEASDVDELTRLESFYQFMLSAVKDKLLTKRIQDIVKECLISLSS